MRVRRNVVGKTFTVFGYLQARRALRV